MSRVYKLSAQYIEMVYPEEYCVLEKKYIIPTVKIVHLGSNASIETSIPLFIDEASKNLSYGVETKMEEAILMIKSQRIFKEHA